MRAELPSSVEVPDRAAGSPPRSPSTCPAPPRCCPTRTGACAGRARWRATARSLLSASSSDRWELEVDGEAVDQIEPFGWATGFEVGDGGEATLRFRTPLVRYGVVALQAIAWLWVLRVLVRRRFEAADRRRVRAGRGDRPAAARRARSPETADAP